MKVFDDYVLALQALKAGEIDAVYAESPQVAWWQLQAEKAGEEPLVVIYSGKPYWLIAWVANKKADILVEKINGALADLIEEGILDQLKAKWKIPG